MAHGKNLDKELSLFVAGRKAKSISNLSATSRISTKEMMSILDKLKGQQNRESTAQTYHTVWQQFNSFLIKLDNKPPLWEDRAALYGAFLVNNGVQSCTLKSYISAIKTVLKADDIKNDIVHTQFPIRIGLLELLLGEIHRIFNESNPQPYLIILYQSILCLGYYGLMRIGELTKGPHVLRAQNVHMGENKNKLLLVLYSSKTHSKESRPQEIKICEIKKGVRTPERQIYCPFAILRKYIRVRGNYIQENEQFFVFSDHSPVEPIHVRSLLKKAIKRLGLNPKCYNTMLMRIGRATDLMRKKVQFGIY